jgi:hypothetical protein
LLCPVAARASLTAAHHAAARAVGTARRGFHVGAASVSFTPPRFGALKRDPVNCVGPAEQKVYDGRRRFAFEDPYIDLHHVGHYSLGDPYVDCAHDGRWVGNTLGGGGNSPRFYDKVADQVGARAMVVSNGRRTIAVEAVDNEGLFNIYADRIRAKVAADGVHLSAINISSTHDESAPDTIGLGGVNELTSGVNPFFADYLVDRSAIAIERAYRRMQPARIRYVEALEPRNLLQCWSSYPFVDDQIMPTLQAVGRDGRAIVTMTSVSQHSETLGFNPSRKQSLWVSGDWPHFFRRTLQARFGGVGIELAGSVGSVETPQIWSQPVSRTPQKFVDASHPAGCRTTFVGRGREVPLGYHRETARLGQDLAGAVIAALGRRATWSRSHAIWAATTNVCMPLTNALFLAAASAGVFGGRPGYLPGCKVAAPTLPNGVTTGTSVLSPVGAFQIGDAGFLSLPGEVFPFTYLRGFLGPQDMPYPKFALPPWPMPYLKTRYRFFVGLSDDMAGYIFPKGNGVGVPGEYPTTNPSASDTDRFGCGHSDDSESTGSNAANLLGSALVRLLRAHYGTPERVSRGRYVLPSGRLSRDPLGSPASLNCSTHTRFRTAKHPATEVWLPGGRIVRPTAWLSLSGRPQPEPNRNTRGYICAGGRHRWINVFPPIPGAPKRISTGVSGTERAA